MPHAAPQISTTVRFIRWSLAVTERLAPDWLARRALARFCRPQRVTSRWNGVDAGARAFTLDTGTLSLPAWEWNVDGAAGTALLVHGWSGNASHLRAYVQPLVARGHHVVAVDLPAHGAAPGSFATILSLGDAIASAVRALQPSLLIAHSLGATAATWALTLGAEVDRVVLLAPAVELPPYLRHFGDAVGLSRAMQARVLADIERLIGRPVDEVDLRRHAPTLGHVRALVVHDVDDVVTPVEGSRALAARWPNATLFETSGQGHDGVRKSAELVEQVVEGALAGAWNQRRPARAGRPQLSLTPAAR